MTNIAKYNLKTILLPTLAVVLLLVVLGVAFAPSSDGFDWSVLNPVEAASALAFAFGFGLGLPDGAAMGLVVLLLLLFWVILFCFVRERVR